MQRLAFTLLAILFACPTQAQEWGDLTVRFVYDGEPPKPKAFSISSDKKVCREGEVFDESLVVNEKDRGITNVVMWLQPDKSRGPLLVHPDLVRPGKEVVLSVKGCRYDPHVVLARTSQTLVGHNHDPIGHVPKIEFINNNSSSAVIPAAGHWDILQLTRAEPNPVKVTCSIHPWMLGWLFVHDSPYMAVSDAGGKLTMPKLPTGKWTFRVWHERKGYIRVLTQDGQPIELPRQGWSLEIKPGKNDLGDVLVKPAQFERN